MNRLWRWARNTVLAVVALLSFGIVAVLYGLHHLAVTPLAPEPDQPLMSWHRPLPKGPIELAEWEQRALADQQASFDPVVFANPPTEYRPWTRWWWPGNVVDADELVREMQVFSDQGFGGVEIQAIASDISESDKNDPRFGVNGWDSPAFYDNVRKVLDSARELGMRVDLTAGSGWPSGGPHVGLQDGMQSIVHGEHIVSGPVALDIELPAPKMPVHWRVLSWVNAVMPTGFFSAGHESLLTVVASKVVANGRTLNPIDVRDQVTLDANSSIVLDDMVNGDGRLQWQVPEGEWAITSFYRMPGGESGMAAIPRTTYVVDHFDSERLNAHYNYLFRPETGLSDYFGRTLRGFFNDSFEFKEERIWPKNHFDVFEAHYNYDPRPHLQSVVQTGHDLAMYHWAKIEATHEYGMSEIGKRFEYDWEQSVSDSFIQRFIDGSRDWAETHKLASRTQAYGFEFDLIKAAGHTSIPETEQQGGSMLFMKMPSSGAWLYDRPLVTAESFIHKRRAWMSTPAKVKAQAQQLFAAGVNQLIYHGSPYQIQNPEQRGYHADGWYPFASATFSEDFSEQHPHWQQLKTVNTYIARQQYLLRLGKPDVDVLVYYPWLGFPLEGIGEDTFLIAGQFDGEPKVSNASTLPIPLPVGFHDPREAWLASILPHLHALEARGLTWQWINQEKIAELSSKHGKLYNGPSNYQALLVHDMPHLSPATAGQLVKLADQGAAIIVNGTFPERHSGLATGDSQSLAEADQRVVESMQKLSARAMSLAGFMSGPSVYHADGVQQLRRRLSNGDVLIYFNNTVREKQFLTFRLPSDFSAVSVIDAWSGTTWPLMQNSVNNNQQSEVEVELPAYGARVLLLSDQWLADTRSDPDRFLMNASLLHRVELDKWRLRVNEQSVSITQLQDWRQIPQLRDSDANAMYSSEIELSPREGSRVVLDLGEVFGVVQVSVNGQLAGEVIAVPFTVDVTELLRAESNQIDIHLIPPRRNAQVREQAAYASGPAAAMGSSERSAAGLLGPVRLQYWGANGSNTNPIVK